MLTDEQTTDLQFAINDADLEAIDGLLGRLTAQELTELQFYSNSTVLMYSLERSTPSVVERLIKHGAKAFELPWSDNNELKSALRNAQHAPEMVELALRFLEPELAREMITSDWDPEDVAEGQAESALQLAEKLTDPRSLQLLRGAMEGPRALT